MLKKIDENILLVSSQLIKQKQYWINKLSADMTVTEIQPDRNKTNTRDQNKTEKTGICFPENLSQRLIKFSKNSELSLYILLLTGLKLLIYRYTGNEDIGVFSPLYKSNVHNETINRCLLIRSSISGVITFIQLLLKIKQSVLEAYENQDYPFDKLVEYLFEGSSNHPDRTFSNFSCSLKNIHSESNIKVLGGKLSFIFRKEKDRVTGNILYDSTGFSRLFADQLLKHFVNILQNAMENINITISHMTCLSKEEQQRLIFDFNHTEAGYPKEKTIHQLYAEQSEKIPDHTALVGENSKQEGTGGLAPLYITYRELNQGSDQLAHLLLEKGVKPDTIVGIMMERSIEMIIDILGILKAGGAYLPIDPGCPRERINYMLADSNAKILVTAPWLSEEFEDLSIVNCQREIACSAQSNSPLERGASSTYFKKFGGGGVCLNLQAEANPSQLAYIIYTSGSAGKPKGVPVAHRNVVRLVKETNYFHWKTGAKLLLTGSIVFDITTFEIWGPLLNGLTLYLVHQNVILEGEKLKEVLGKNKINILHLIPQLFNQLADQYPELFQGLDYFLVGGDLVPPHYVNYIRNRYKDLNILHMYGPTENTTFSTFFPVDKDYEISIPIGKPISNSSVFILDKYNQLVPMGVPGELIVGGDGVARGYLNQPELTHEKFKIKNGSGPLRADLNAFDQNKKVPGSNNYMSHRSYRSYIYRTGDLARWLEDGNIEFLGRRDNQVKIRGARIELAEIENKLLNYENIKEAVVIQKQRNTDAGIEGRSKEETYLCAYIVPNGDRAEGKAEKMPSIVEELTGYLSQSLPNYMIPNYFVSMENLPLSSNGKVDRKRLPVPDWGAAAQMVVAPRDYLEEQLVETWADVLGIGKEAVGIDSNFFELGGHSLKVTILAGHIHKKLQVKIPVAEIFKSPNIRMMSEYIKAAAKEIFASIPVAEEKDYYPLSSAQHRLYVLQQIDPETIAYNIYMIYELGSQSERGKLEEIFKNLINRHESLRTSFEMIQGTPVQKIHQPSGIVFKLEYDDISGDKVEIKGDVTRSPAQEIVNHFVRPFELSQAPLIRAGLIKIEPLRHLLMVDMHHIITDGFSHRILIEDFTSLYSGNRLLELKLQYKDYSEWQQSQTVKQACKKQEEYWLQQFEGEIPVLNMSTDYPRPATQNFEGNTIGFELSKKETNALNEMARSERGTLFMVLLAVYIIFLSKITNQEDIVVGTPIVGRKHADLERTIGMFVNTLALRNFPSREKRFLELLTEVRERTMEAYENQFYPFEELVGKVAVARDMSRNPLFDVMLAFQNIFETNKEALEQEIEDTKIKTYSYEHRVSKFDLTLEAIEASGGLFCGFEYCSRLFKKETMVRFVKYIKKIVSAVIDNPGKKIAEIDIITEEEKNRILYDFNNTGAEYPKDKVIHELFEEQVERTSDNIALIGMINQKSESPSGHLYGNSKQIQMTKIQNSKQEGTGGLAPLNITYRELNQRSNQLAHLLLEKGVKPDTIAGIMAERSIEMIIGILGILKAGGAYLPIDPEYPRERINYMLADSNAKILVTVPWLSEEFEELSIVNCQREIACPAQSNSPLERGASSTYFKKFGGGGVCLNLQAEANPSQLAYIIYTSGTTGKSKGVMIQHYSLVNRLNWMQKKYPIDETDTILHKTPFTFDVSVWEIIWWGITGAKVCLLVPRGEKEPGTIVNTIAGHGITVIHFVPSMLNAFLDYLKLNPEEVKKLSCLKQVIASGEALMLSHVKRFSQLLYQENSTKLANLYGPTEAAIDVSYYDCVEREEYGQRESIPIGKPIDNIRIYILDKHWLVQPVGIAGELSISGPGLARGYLNRPELTAERFRSVLYRSYRSYIPKRIYRTGDLARWQSDGNIEFLGRLDYQVKIRGFRIEPGEIESHLLRYHKVKEAVVIDRQTPGSDDDSTRYLCAYIVSDDDFSSFLPELREFLSGVQPDYMIPAYYVRLDKIPLTANGKIDRGALPEPGPGTTTGEDYEPPTDELEETLTRIWEDVLNIKNISIKNNFFSIGGDSIKAIRLISLINSKQNTHLTIPDLYKNNTIKTLAVKIREKAPQKNRDAANQLKKVLQEIEELKNKIITANQLPLANGLDIDDIEDIYPMSDIQKGMVFSSLIDPDSAVYHDQMVHHVRYRDFDPERFNKALELMVDKHPILRTGFNMENVEEVVQIVYRSCRTDIQHYDISHLHKDKVQGYLNKFMEQDRKTPFNMATPPIWRIRTFALDKENIIVLCVFHHAIIDGWSDASFNIELNNIYLELKANPGFVPSTLKSSYKDFVVQQVIEKRKSSVVNYWRNQLAQYKRLDFSIFSRQQEPDRLVQNRGIWVNFGGLLLKQLKETARKYNTSVKNLCFAAYVYMLSMLCYEDDLVVGLINHNRPECEDGDKILGCFLNTVPVRIRVKPGITWENYILRVDRKLLELAKYDKVSLFEIARIIGETTQDRNPILDTFFNFIDFHVYQQAITEEIEKIEPNDPKQTEIDSYFDGENAVEGHVRTNTLLDFNINTTFEIFAIGVSYSTLLFDESEIKRLCGYLKNVLEKFIHDPGGMVRKESILSDAETKKLLKELNHTTGTGVSRCKTLHEFFADQAAKRLDAVALAYRHQQLTYNRLSQMSHRLAKTLRRKGIGPDSLVGIIMERSLEMVIGLLAILKAGGAYVPIDTQYPEERKTYMLKHSGTKLVLTNLQVENVSASIPAGIMVLDPRDAELYSNPVTSGTQMINKETNLAYVIYTSGSTGRPKGIMLEHRNLVNWVTNNLTRTNIDFTRVLQFATISFDVSFTEIFSTLLAGGRLYLIDEETIHHLPRLFKLVKDNDIKTLFLPPSLLRVIFNEEDLISLLPPGVTHIVCAGEQLVVTPRFRQYLQQRKVFLHNHYGPSETHVVTALTLDPSGNIPEIPSIGKPILNTIVYILDKNRQLQPMGVAGELAARGAQVGRGYLDHPGLTAEKFILAHSSLLLALRRTERVKNTFQKELRAKCQEPGAKLYLTGDQARWLPDGNIEFLGRIDQQVKIRGFRIELEEIESQLVSHEKIKNAVAAVKEDNKGEPYLCAFIVAAEEAGGKEIMERMDLRAYLLNTLPGYMIPSHFVVLDKIPLTPNGKIDRKALPNPEIKAGASFIAPRNEIEEKITGIWAEVLGMENHTISIDANFFQLGGHSLKATTMMSKIHKELDVEISLADIFRTPTIEGIAALVKVINSIAGGSRPQGKDNAQNIKEIMI